jgi:hypothetical protein
MAKAGAVTAWAWGWPEMDANLRPRGSGRQQLALGKSAARAPREPKIATSLAAALLPGTRHWLKTHDSGNVGRRFWHAPLAEGLDPGRVSQRQR